MGIIRLNQLPDGSGNLTNDDIFVFMDDPSGSGVTKKISLSEISGAIGGGNPFDQDLNTFNSPTFSGISLTSSISGVVFADASIQNSAGLSDSSTYIICKTGDDIAAKYASAKTLTPRGDALSSTNRATLIVMPGNYSLSEEWVIDTEFVDILGLGSMKLDRGCVTAVTLLNYTINVTANDVRVKGIGVGSQIFKIGNDLPLQIIEDCVGGNSSFGDSGNTLSGSFINCVGGDSSFGSGVGSIASGNFTNCVGGNGSFGHYGTASGIFRNCKGGEYGGFGSGVGAAPGIASGQFYNCIGGFNSFGSSFDGGIVNGFFENCSAKEFSFGTNTDTVSGTFLKCTLLTGTFPTLSGTGKIRLCIDGNYDVINADAPPSP